jgi:hypothetical protein
MASAEMELIAPAGTILAFNVMNGFLNAGTATHVLLAVGGCPQAPLIAGSVLAFHTSSFAICIGGSNVTVDCSPNPQAWPNDSKSYTDAGIPACPQDDATLCVVSVEESSWGSIKSLYR